MNRQLRQGRRQWTVVAAPACPARVPPAAVPRCMLVQPFCGSSLGALGGARIISLQTRASMARHHSFNRQVQSVHMSTGCLGRRLPPGPAEAQQTRHSASHQPANRTPVAQQPGLGRSPCGCVSMNRAACQFSGRIYSRNRGRWTGKLELGVNNFNGHKVRKFHIFWKEDQDSCERDDTMEKWRRCKSAGAGYILHHHHLEAAGAQQQPSTAGAAAGAAAGGCARAIGRAPAAVCQLHHFGQ